MPDGVSVDNDNSDQKVACVTLSPSLSAVGSPAGGEVGGGVRGLLETRSTYRAGV